jgi:hypothetical protein
MLKELYNFYVLMVGTAVVVLTDVNYFPRAKRTIIDVRTRGKWTEDIVLITIGFDASKNFTDFYEIITKRFEPINTDYLIGEYNKHPLKTVEDKRHLLKLSQWNKFYVFDEWFLKWSKIIYLDAGLRVFDRISYLDELPCTGKLLAPDDVPTYGTQRFEAMLELSANPAAAERLIADYSADILKERYFLNCIWVYDTMLIRKCGVSQMIETMNKYPVCRCNEMTIMNLLFTFKYKVWGAFPDFASNGKRLFGWIENDRDYGPYKTWRDFCFIKYPYTINMECE